MRSGWAIKSDTFVTQTGTAQPAKNPSLDPPKSVNSSSTNPRRRHHIHLSLLATGLTERRYFDFPFIGILKTTSFSEQ
jgi:hypothetical protein